MSRWDKRKKMSQKRGRHKNRGRREGKDRREVWRNKIKVTEVKGEEDK